MSTAHNTLSLRTRSPILRYYPLQFIDVTQPFDNQVSDMSHLRRFGADVENYEEELANKYDQDSMCLQAILGDPTAQTYSQMATRKIQDRLSDTITAHLCQYRILDFEVGCWGTKTLASPPRVPQRISDGNFGRRAHRQFLGKLQNWRAIVVDLVNLVNADKYDNQDVVVHLDTPYRRSFGHLQGLSEAHVSAEFETIIQNFRTAAFHLTLLQESTFRPNALPDIPLTGTDVQNMELSLPKTDLEKYSNDTRGKIVRYLAAHKPADIRVPLHMSLLISMLVLVIPINLLKVAFPRLSIYPLSIAIGNQQPPLLVSVEREIWKALLRICEDSTRMNIRQVLLDLVESQAFCAVINLPANNAMFSFFHTNDINNTAIMPHLQIPPSASEGSAHGAPPVVATGLNAPPRVDEQVPTHVQAAVPPQSHELVPPATDVNMHPPADGVPSQANVSTPPQINQDVSPVPPGDHDGDIDMDLFDELDKGQPDQHEETSAEHSPEQMEVDPPQLRDVPNTEGDADAEGDEDPDMTAAPGSSNDDNNDNDDEETDRPTSARVRPTDRIKCVGPDVEESHSDVDNSDPPVTKLAEPRRSRRIKSTAAAATKGAASFPKRSRSKKAKESVESESDDEEAADEEDANEAPVAEAPVEASSETMISWAKIDTFVPRADPTQFAANNEPPPLKHGDQVIANGHDGNCLLFEPIAHYPENLKILESIISSMKEGYQDGTPLHLANDESKPSVFKIYTHNEFEALDDSVVQDILRRQHIVITGRPNRPLGFEQALRRLANLHRVTEFQDQSLAADSGPQIGKVRDLVNASSSTATHSNKILNGLFFPYSQAGTEPTVYASDCHALSTVILHEGWPKRPWPTGDIRWGLAATAGALHRWHIDSDGFGTFVEPICGSKWWFVARPIGDLEPDVFNTTSVLLNEHFDLDKSGKGLFAIEGFLLQPGSMLIMRPNTLHTVYTPEDAVCRGGHFYATSTMCDTFVGLVHTFVCDNYITNISHPPSRFILAEMINFYHSGIVKAEIDNNDPAAAHIPDPSKIRDFTELLVACGLGALMNVLSLQTYLAPCGHTDCLMDDDDRLLWYDNDVNALPEEDRKLLCLARGQSFEIVACLNAKFRIHGSNIDTPHKLFSSILVNMCKMILHYKWQADEEKVVHNPNFTLDKMHVQLTALLSMSYVGCDESDTTTWKLPLYEGAGCPMLPNVNEDHSLEAIPGAQYTRLSLADLFKSGETALDQSFARRMDIKREHAEKFVDNSDAPQNKKRKLNA